MSKDLELEHGYFKSPGNYTWQPTRGVLVFLEDGQDLRNFRRAGEKK